MMTLASFVARALSLRVALKGHLLGHALSSFQRSLPLQPNPDLDAPDSFRLPSADDLSSQGNGDFSLSHPLCQARQSLTRRAIFSCPRPRLCGFSADETAAPSHVSPEREAARQTRSLFTGMS